MTDTGNARLSSIVTQSKQTLVKTQNSSCSSTVINMPQSMTVFNLKEISSKVFSQLKNFQPKSATCLNLNKSDLKTPDKKSTTSLIYNSVLQTDNNQTNTNNSNKADEVSKIICTENDHFASHNTKLDFDNNNNSLTIEDLSKLF